MGAFVFKMLIVFSDRLKNKDMEELFNKLLFISGELYGFTKSRTIFLRKRLLIEFYFRITRKFSARLINFEE